MDVEELAKARLGRSLRNKWRLEALLGTGAMAAVYLARHLNNGKRAAVKMMHPELAQNADLQQRFLREGYAANAVGHPGAVAVLDDDVDDDGSAYLVMELLDGESLEHRCERKGGTLDPNEVLAVVDKLLDVLAAAHEKAIVHRDVKPDNVFLSRDGVVKLLDFGIARLAERALSDTESTRIGIPVGTPTFMPPEQASGRWDTVDGRADLWSVGALVFTCVSGRHVHEGRDLTEQLFAAATKTARSLREVAPDAHPALVRLVDGALGFDKETRWANARAMQEAVREAFWALRTAGTPSLRLSIPDVLPAVSHEISIRQQEPALVAAARAAARAAKQEAAPASSTRPQGAPASSVGRKDAPASPDLAYDATERFDDPAVRAALAREEPPPRSLRTETRDAVVVFERGADGSLGQRPSSKSRQRVSAPKPAAKPLAPTRAPEPRALPRNVIAAAFAGLAVVLIFALLFARR